MTIVWAVRFPRMELEQIGRLWNVAEVEVCEQADAVWLRGTRHDDVVQNILRGLLSGKRFGVLADGQLQSPKSRLPKGHLPSGPWRPIRDWMTLSLPSAALSGQTPERVRLTLTRSDHFQDPEVLLTTIAAWLRYGDEAPLVRLGRLQFAMKSGGDVLIRGQPLPSMPGRRFAVTDQIAVPAGWTWSPPVAAAVLHDVFGLKPGDLAVIQPDGGSFTVRAGSFVEATRQAIRASSEMVVA